MKGESIYSFETTVILSDDRKDRRLKGRDTFPFSHIIERTTFIDKFMG